MKETKVKKDFSRGEASPYRQWQDTRSGFLPEKELDEMPEANPDVLSEQKSLWSREEATEEQKELVQKILSKLTPRQRQILELVGLEGKTFEHAAAMLSVSKGTIQKTIEQIRKKVTDYGLRF